MGGREEGINGQSAEFIRRLKIRLLNNPNSIRSKTDHILKRLFNNLNCVSTKTLLTQKRFLYNPNSIRPEIGHILKRL